ncbi:MAG: electron transport complex subunit RsxC, partial [Planctomycetota bacterium]
MGLLTRRGRLSGGIFLSDDKSETQQRPVHSIAAPPRLCVPLVQHNEPPAAPCVQSGDRVTAGQVIARPGRSADLGVLLHAPVNATVGTIVT